MTMISSTHVYLGILVVDVAITFSDIKRNMAKIAHSFGGKLRGSFSASQLESDPKSFGPIHQEIKNFHLALVCSHWLVAHYARRASLHAAYELFRCREV